MRKIINKAFSKKVMASFLLASVVLTGVPAVKANAGVVDPTIPRTSQTNKISVQTHKLKEYEPAWLKNYRKMRMDAAPGSGYKLSYDPLNLKVGKQVMYKTSYGETCMGLKEQKVTIKDVKREYIGVPKDPKQQVLMPETRIVNGNEVTKNVAVPMERVSFKVVVDPSLKAISPHNIATTMPQLIRAGVPIGKVGIELVDANTGLCLSGSYGKSKGITFTQFREAKTYEKALRGETFYFKTKQTSIPVTVEYPVVFRDRICVAVHGYDNEYLNNFVARGSAVMDAATKEFRDGKVTYDNSVLESTKKDINHLGLLKNFK